MITYSFTFPNLSCIRNNNGKVNEITTVDWILTGIDDSGYNFHKAGKVTLPPYTNDTPFIEFDNITKEIVESWVTSILGEPLINAMKNEIENEIQKLVNPIIIDIIPTWETPSLGNPMKMEQLLWVIMSRAEFLIKEAYDLKKVAHNININEIPTMTPEILNVFAKYNTLSLADKIDALTKRLDALTNENKKE